MSPVKPPEPNTDKATRVKETIKGVVRKVMSEKALTARSRSRSIMGENYQTLRLTCTELPTTGRIARSRILQAGYMRIRALEERVRHLQAQLGGPPPSSPGTARRTPGTVRRTDHRPCAIPGLCRFHYGHGSLLHSADPRGGAQPPGQGSLLHSADPRGGAQPPAKEVSYTQLNPGVVPPPPEVQVVWQGAQTSRSSPRQSGQRSYQVRRPYLADSPPLQERSWIPTTSGTIWKPYHEIITPISSTPEKTSSATELTMVSPMNLRIPVSELFPGTQWTSTSQSSMATANVTTYTVTPNYNESGLVGPMTPEALAISSPRATSTSTRSGSMNSRLDCFLHMPIRSTSTSTDSGLLEVRSTVLSSASTMTELTPPVEALHWPLSPSVTSSDVLSPTRTIPLSPWSSRLTLLSPLSPAQQFFPREDRWPATRLPTSTSTRKVATATRSLKVAQWVSNLQADREHTGDGWSPISPTSNLLEVARSETEAEPLGLDHSETNETGAEPARRRNLPTHNKQAGSTSVDSVVVAEEDGMVTMGPEIESRETTNAESSKDEELTTEGYQVNKSNQANEVSQSGLEINLHKKLGEYMEPEEVGKIKAEEHSKNKEGLTADSCRNQRNTSHGEKSRSKKRLKNWNRS